MEVLHNKPTTTKDDKHKLIRRRILGVPTRHDHFTRSWMQRFLAQSVVCMNEQGYQKHITNNCYHHDTGTKQTIEKL